MFLVTTPWKGRVNYLRMMMATLRDSMQKYGHPATTLIYDNNEEQIRFPMVSAIASTVVRKIKSSDCHRLYVDMINNAISLYPEHKFILNVDADAIVHPELIGTVLKAIEELPDLGWVSFFNESCHPEPTEVVLEKYHVRKHASFLCLLFRCEAWKQFVPPNPGEQFRFGCVDGMFTTFVTESTQFKGYSTIRSYADHIGFGGSHANEIDGICTSSRGRRFYS